MDPGTHEDSKVDPPLKGFLPLRGGTKVEAPPRLDPRTHEDPKVGIEAPSRLGPQAPTHAKVESCDDLKAMHDGSQILKEFIPRGSPGSDMLPLDGPNSLEPT